ncbi:hypothetical protein SmJEL517_g03898 [Synchytrium microbalum]|uniref:GATA-type domain-containing protein n=1 Tax=Synchytrium microbalum TaxID=1806994 RepID=A0A507BU97_9FUNG|nr:uncharacterized protein SmJEL517_g03898 [Synchytrium microbalum]TPX33070.1 hypothetical protein SmJEL517_g03898 [Synchytrium microbalum]
MPVVPSERGINIYSRQAYVQQAELSDSDDDDNNDNHDEFTHDDASDGPIDDPHQQPKIIAPHLSHIPYKTNKSRKPASHLLFKKQDLQRVANHGVKLVPVKLDLEVDGIKLKDQFTWNVHEAHITPEHFANMQVQDMDVPEAVAKQFAPMIASAIREQIRELATAVEDEDAHYQVDDTERIIVKLDLNVGNLHLTDQFEWPLFATSHSSPEDFAKQLCADLGIGGEFQPAIAHSIREQVAHARLAFESAPKPLPFDRLVSAPVRNEGTEVLWQPTLQELTEEDIERLSKEKERENRRARRNQARVTRTTTNSMAAAMTNSAFDNMRATRNRMMMPPQKVPYQNYMPNEEELRIQREHVHKYLPTPSPGLDMQEHPIINNTSSPMPISSSVDRNGPVQPLQDESAHHHHHHIHQQQQQNEMIMPPNFGLRQPNNNNGTIQQQQTQQQQSASSSQPMAYFQFQQSPFAPFSPSYPSPPLQYGGLSLIPSMFGNMNGSLPPQLLHMPMNPYTMSQQASIHDAALMQQQSHSQHHQQLGPPKPKKSNKRASPIPVDTELLARQLVLLTASNNGHGHGGQSSGGSATPSPTKFDADGAPLKKHRGFGASAQMFNADGSIEVGEFRKNWKCSWCFLSGKFTPTLRKGPLGSKTLCNACGIWFSKHGSLPQERYHEHYDV